MLLVDDDEFVRSSMRAVLEELGHTATEADDGEGALLLVEAGCQPDLVIMDMNMPGLGGSGTLPRLRALCPLVPVLLATGRVDQGVQDLVAAHDRVTLLSKPFTMKELEKQLNLIGR